MLLEDPVLPAVAQLSGPDAHHAIGTAVAGAGGRLHDLRCSQVHWVPGAELVVRYRCDITWPDGRTSDDTLLAATTRTGPLPGTIPVVAEHDGVRFEASVWRWPFDPIVTGLPTASTRRLLADALGDLVELPIATEVLAYRPTARAVVKVVDGRGRVLYVKALPPDAVSSLAARHDHLRRAGIPAPEVLGTDHEHGLLVLAESAGTTLRERIKGDMRPWPGPAAILELSDRIAALGPSGGSARASRTRDAIAHVALLESILPECRAPLEALRQRFTDTLQEVEERSTVTIHGDLHEAQLIVDEDGSITGVLDIDDFGVGDPVDDPATLIGHLTYRALTAPDPAASRVIRDYVAEIRACFGLRHGAESLDVTTAAVLVGLATGPFRLQHPDWEQTCRSVIDIARSLVDGMHASGQSEISRDEELLRPASRGLHARPAS